ncbi:MAG TPA: hypothetical protein VK154_03790 [Chitinophagales bacterium]|nr:hypothetical protein [Chitinophagales bacterium]
MQNKVNWNKLKIPSFGMSDAMVKYKNGTFSTDHFTTDSVSKYAKDHCESKRKTSI